MPVVTVVVIGYNDAANLEHAVRSATAQTLRDIEVVVVDDASTDQTPAVTARLAASDPRVRVVRLPENSGGCSRPRNVGLDQATGRYVTFLDSDDLLHRRACERLAAAARRVDADMVCGRYVRRHLHPRRFIAAHDELYLRPAVLDTILDRPEQLRDTPACSKLYRRGFLLDAGLAFPEGLLFEDLLFTTQAYCTAHTIAVVPQLVYVWNVRRGADTPSITNRRDVRNWRDRFEIHRRIDRFLDERGMPPALREAKHRKFLDVDFAFFLRQLREFAPETRAELLQVARGYVAGVPLVSDEPAVRVGAFLTGHGDVDAVLTAADYVATGGIGARLVVDAGRTYWTESYVDSADARRALDVTGTGVLTAPFERTPFLAVASTVAVEGTTLRVRGVVHDVLGRLGEPAGATAALEVSGRLGAALASVPATVHQVDAGWAFEAAVDLAAVGRRLLRPTVGHELRLGLALRRDGAVARRPLSARDADLPAAGITLPTPWRAFVGGRARAGEVNGRLVLTLTALPGLVDRAIDAVSLARYAGRRMWLTSQTARRARSVSIDGEGE